MTFAERPWNDWMCTLLLLLLLRVVVVVGRGREKKLVLWILRLGGELCRCVRSAGAPVASCFPQHGLTCISPGLHTLMIHVIQLFTVTPHFICLFIYPALFCAIIQIQIQTLLSLYKKYTTCKLQQPHFIFKAIFTVCAIKYSMPSINDFICPQRGSWLCSCRTAQSMQIHMA